MARQTPSILQVLDSINVVSGLVSRMDERVKILGENQDSMIENIKSLENKVQVMELKIEDAKTKLGKHDAIWDKIFDMVWKTVLMVLAGYILYVLGLQADLAFPPP
jgi:hypothetical protein